MPEPRGTAAAEPLDEQLHPSLRAFLDLAPHEDNVAELVRRLSAVQALGDSDAAWRRAPGAFGSPHSRSLVMDRVRDWLSSSAARFDNVVSVCTIACWYVALEDDALRELAAHPVLPLLVLRASRSTGLFKDGMLAASRTCSVLWRLVSSSDVQLSWDPRTPALFRASEFGGGDDAWGEEGGEGGGVAPPGTPWSPHRPFSPLWRTQTFPGAPGALPPIALEALPLACFAARTLSLYPEGSEAAASREWLRPRPAQEARRLLTALVPRPSDDPVAAAAPALGCLWALEHACYSATSCGVLLELVRNACTRLQVQRAVCAAGGLELLADHIMGYVSRTDFTPLILIHGLNSIFNVTCCGEVRERLRHRSGLMLRLSQIASVALRATVGPGGAFWLRGQQVALQRSVAAAWGAALRQGAAPQQQQQQQAAAGAVTDDPLPLQVLGMPHAANPPGGAGLPHAAADPAVAALLAATGGPGGPLDPGAVAADWAAEPAAPAPQAPALLAAAGPARNTPAPAATSGPGLGEAVSRTPDADSRLLLEAALAAVRLLQSPCSTILGVEAIGAFACASDASGGPPLLAHMLRALLHGSGWLERYDAHTIAALATGARAEANAAAAAAAARVSQQPLNEPPSHSGGDNFPAHSAVPITAEHAAGAGAAAGPPDAPPDAPAPVPGIAGGVGAPAGSALQQSQQLLQQTQRTQARCEYLRGQALRLRASHAQLPQAEQEAAARQLVATEVALQQLQRELQLLWAQAIRAQAQAQAFAAGNNQLQHAQQQPQPQQFMIHFPPQALQQQQAQQQHQMALQQQQQQHQPMAGLPGGVLPQGTALPAALFAPGAGIPFLGGQQLQHLQQLQQLQQQLHVQQHQQPMQQQQALQLLPMLQQFGAAPGVPFRIQLQVQQPPAAPGGVPGATAPALAGGTPGTIGPAAPGATAGPAAARAAVLEAQARAAASAAAAVTAAAAGSSSPGVWWAAVQQTLELLRIWAVHPMVKRDGLAPLLVLLRTLAFACGRDINGVPDGVRVGLSALLNEFCACQAHGEAVAATLDLMEPPEAEEGPPEAEVEAADP